MAKVGTGSGRTAIVQVISVHDGYTLGREPSGYYRVIGPRGGHVGVYAYLVDAVLAIQQRTMAREG